MTATTAKAGLRRPPQTLLITSLSQRCTRLGRMRTSQNISRLGRTSPTQRWPRGPILFLSQKKSNSKRIARFLVHTSNVQCLQYAWLRLRFETVEGEAENQ